MHEWKSRRVDWKTIKKTQGELNKKLEGEKGNKDFFSDYYKGTYAYK